MITLELATSPISDANTKLPTITKLQTQIITAKSLKNLHHTASSLATPPNSPHVQPVCSTNVSQQAMSLTPDLLINVGESVKHTKVVVNSEQNQVQNIELLKTRIKHNNELLRQNLENSYKRLRLIQTKSFQSHVAEQLSTILELKQRQKLESAVTSSSSTLPQLSSLPDESTCVSNDVIDATSVDLLTAILKSNLSNGEASTPDKSSTAVKSLLDDIQYEILKQEDDIKNNVKHQLADSATDNDLTDDDEDQNITLAELAADTECSVDWNNSSSLRNGFSTLTSPEKSCEKTLTDSSNIFWAKNRAQLGSEWTRVQTKMKQLNLKYKQCNDYLATQSILDNLDKNISKKMSADNNSGVTTKRNSSFEFQKESTSPKEKEAIAALSTSLQESVAAEVFAPQEEAVSRCIPYKRSHSSRLFNLSRSDLVELDDEVLKSFYYTLRYFGNIYFKTMCLCSSGERSNSAKKTNYYYQKKQKKLDSDKVYSSSEMLRKTCIFCHLLKKYEQNRMNNSASSPRAAASISQKDRKFMEIERKKQLLEQHQYYQQQQRESQEKKADDSNDANVTVLADPIVVYRDHSYCKQVSLLKKPLPLEDPGDSFSDYSIEGNPQKKYLPPRSEASANVELIDRLVGHRLSRIFDGHVKSEKNDASSSSINENVEQCEGELIDAGLDLTPDDLQNLPDFSYEELKFLNEIELDKSGALRKKFLYVEDSIDMTCESTGYSRDYTIFMANKAYPLTYQMSSEIFNALNYKPKYRSLLNKKRREQKRSDQLQFSRFNRLNDETKKSDVDLKNSSASCNQNRSEKCEKNADKKDSSWQPVKTSSKALSSSAVRPRKRQRSTGSYSSNSSILSSSNTDSNYGGTSPFQKSSSTSSFYSPNQTNPTSKFDIDNIVMPFDMVASAAKPVVLKNVNVPTPMWRENPLETLISITDELEENLDDSYFIELHKFCEKRKFDVVKPKKNKTSNINNRSSDLNLSLPASVLSDSLNNGSNDTNHKLNSSLNLTKCQTAPNFSSKWTPRKFPLSDQDYESLANQQKQMELEQTSKKCDDDLVTKPEEIN